MRVAMVSTMRDSAQCKGFAGTEVEQKCGRRIAPVTVTNRVVKQVDWSMDKASSSS